MTVLTNFANGASGKDVRDTVQDMVTGAHLGRKLPDALKVSGVLATILGGQDGFDYYGENRRLDSFAGANDTAKAAAAFAWSNTTHGRIMGYPGKTYNVDLDAFTIDLNYVAFDGNGCEFATSATSGTMFKFISDATAVDTRFRSKAGRGGFRNCLMTGPGIGVGTATAILWGDRSNGSVVHGVRIQRFFNAQEWGNNTWCTELGHFEVNNCTYAGRFPSGLINAGERITLHDFTVSNGTYGFENFGAMMQMDNFSIDYMTNEKLIWGLGGDFAIDHYHLESSQNNAPWFRGANGKTLTVGDGMMAVTGARSIPLGISDAPTKSAINCSGVIHLIQTAGWGTLTYLFEGLGTPPRAMALYNPTIPTPPSHSRNNMLFDSANNLILRDWRNTSTVASRVTRTITSGDFPSSVATAGIKIAPLAGERGRLELWMKVTPGEQLFFAGWHAFLGKGGADVLYRGVQFYDRNGSLLGSSNSMTTLNANAPTSPDTFVYTPEFAPVGASWARFTVGKGASFDGVSDGTGYMTLANVVATGSRGARLASHAELPAALIATTHTSPTTMYADSINYIDTSAGAFVTPMLLPSQGLVKGTFVRVTVLPGSSANPPTIGRNGSPINGAAADDAAVAPGTYIYEYYDATTGWMRR